MNRPWVAPACDQALARDLQGEGNLTAHECGLAARGRYRTNAFGAAWQAMTPSLMFAYPPRPPRRRLAFNCRELHIYPHRRPGEVSRGERDLVIVFPTRY